MTPLLVVTIMYIIYIERYIGNGPFWKYMTNIRTQKCVSRWWMPLVYIQNYKDPWNGVSRNLKMQDINCIKYL